MKFIYTSFLLTVLIGLISCSPAEKAYTLSMTNTLDIARDNTTIEIAVQEIIDYLGADTNVDSLVVFSGDQKVRRQLVDSDANQKADLLVFQANFGANETKSFVIKKGSYTASDFDKKQTTFCRFIPERIDDFAWENDKVAFRTYGPKCQQMFEQNTPGGLISSGIDCWTKSVSYPIIDKWYRLFQEGKSYHEDRGEGFDAYHVGTTRGCGGVAIVKNNTHVLSQNFASWKIIANGPIQSIFELAYPATALDSTNSVLETKRIKLNLGTHLYHCTVSYKTNSKIDTTAIGLALHQKKGSIVNKSKQGWFSYWEPMQDSEIGTGIIVDPEIVNSVVINDSLAKDESLNNIWVHTKVKENKVAYWAGFGWKKSGAFESAEAWQKYLELESLKNQNPIQIEILTKQ